MCESVYFLELLFAKNSFLFDFIIVLPFLLLEHILKKFLFLNHIKFKKNMKNMFKLEISFLHLSIPHIYLISRLLHKMVIYSHYFQFRSNSLLLTLTSSCPETFIIRKIACYAASSQSYSGWVLLLLLTDRGREQKCSSFVNLLYLSYNNETCHSYTFINYVRHPLSSADISIFSTEIKKFCHFKEYRQCLHFDT